LLPNLFCKHQLLQKKYFSECTFFYRIWIEVGKFGFMLGIDAAAFICVNNSEVYSVF